MKESSDDTICCQITSALAHMASSFVGGIYMVRSIHDVDRPRLEGLYSLCVQFSLILVPFPWSDFGRGRQIDERLSNITSPRYLSSSHS